MAIAAVLGGEMPTTLLLRLTYHESVVYVGVQDFIQDSIAVGWLRLKKHTITPKAVMEAALPSEAQVLPPHPYALDPSVTP